jgi:hypothetical protein
MKKNMQFIISYSFNGTGTARVTAKSEKEARDKFFSGDFEELGEDGTDYNIDRVDKDE